MPGGPGSRSGGVTLDRAGRRESRIAEEAAINTLSQSLLLVVEWARQHGVEGAIVYEIVYVAATITMLPGSVLTLGAGFAYGPIGGSLLVSPASVLGATAAFLLGRSIARPWVESRLRRQPRFEAIDRAVERDGFRVVLLLRLSPVIPFNLLNYALGLTRVGFRDYVLGSFLGMLPGTVMYVYLGSVVTSASELLTGRGARSPVPWGRGSTGWGWPPRSAPPS
ncbi:MAG: TVP38/TMEM64 family protein [Candidatus Wallbacteria bacterium]|nr:TVP38/TMEM64 family protein [Candidatus Wallbacteria bacterium]